MHNRVLHVTPKEVADIVEVAEYVLAKPWMFGDGTEILAKGILDLAAELKRVSKS